MIVIAAKIAPDAYPQGIVFLIALLLNHTYMRITTI
jgi:hypothetical protein